MGAAHLRNAVSLNSAAFEVGALGGPAVSALLIGVVGIGYAFVANALSFVVVISALCLIRSSELHTGTRRVPADAGESRVPAMILARPDMFWPIALAGLFAVFAVNLPVTLAALAATVFATGATGYAFLSCALAVGSILGALLSARRAPARLRGLICAAGALAIAHLIASAAPDRWTTGAVLVLVGVASTLVGIGSNTMVQMAAPEHVRGRVVGIYLLLVIGCAAIGGPLVGLLNEHCGPRTALLLGGLGPGLLVLTLAIHFARASHLTVRTMLHPRLSWLEDQVPHRPVRGVQSR